mmetsp:Transcript_41732/g.81870  ORF Transcript_41732/g.81870 Transcript_41732/m.81870 type:complete len:429 (-) Transcript_41732:75-1361(-)|eukprot:CAMPEP_0175097400 /NCGR_PEP_ID=MMETSP0086_2-20121207/5266_1 /TAXON_ID=136419 /ORGANISM="Unknown Unknown, Strain D1" /LENGTH=428 /DNA_ID=CAMNT_0016370907 /DNA_START=38 /DNA_END=1324 /DNA_ORIENTATION=-
MLKQVLLCTALTAISANEPSLVVAPPAVIDAPPGAAVDAIPAEIEAPPADIDAPPGTDTETDNELPGTDIDAPPGSEAGVPSPPTASDSDACASAVQNHCSDVLGQGEPLKVLKCAHRLVSKTDIKDTCKQQLKGSIAAECAMDISEKCEVSGDFRSFTSCLFKHHRGFEPECKDALSQVKHKLQQQYPRGKGKGRGKGKTRGKGEGKDQEGDSRGRGNSKGKGHRGGQSPNTPLAPEAPPAANDNQPNDSGTMEIPPEAPPTGDDNQPNDSGTMEIPPEVSARSHAMPEPLSNAEMYEFLWGGDVKGLSVVDELEEGGHSRHMKHLPAIIGAVVSGVLLLACIACVCVRRRRRKQQEQHVPLRLETQETEFTSISVQGRPATANAIYAAVPNTDTAHTYAYPTSHTPVATLVGLPVAEGISLTSTNA